MKAFDCGVLAPRPVVTSNTTAQGRPVLPGANPSTEPLKPRVLAHYRCTGAVLVIENKDREDWPSLTVLVYTDPATAYQTTIPALKAGGSLEVPLSQFVKDGSQKFDPSTNRATKASIGGNGYEFGSYGF